MATILVQDPSFIDFVASVVGEEHTVLLLSAERLESYPGSVAVLNEDHSYSLPDITSEDDTDLPGSPFSVIVRPSGGFVVVHRSSSIVLGRDPGKFLRGRVDESLFNVTLKNFAMACDAQNC